MASVDSFSILAKSLNKTSLQHKGITMFISSLGLILVAALMVAFCVAVAFLARSSGRESSYWFVASLIVTPIVTGFLLAFLPDLKAEEETKRHRELMAALTGNQEAKSKTGPIYYS